MSVRKTCTQTGSCTPIRLFVSHLDLVNLLVEVLHGRVNLPVYAVVNSVVMGDLIGYGVNGLHGYVERVQGIGDVRVNTCAQSREYCRAQSRCFIHFGEGDGLVEDGGFDLHVELVAYAAADCDDIFCCGYAGMGFGCFDHKARFQR